MAGILRRTRLARTLCLAAMLLAVVQFPAQAADSARGADLFETHCSDCHSVSAKVANRKGPSLFGVVGRKAGVVPGAKYSAAMLAYAVVWNPGTLDTYLANPKGPVPAGTMKFKGLASQSDRADLIAYLATLK